MLENQVYSDHFGQQTVTLLYSGHGSAKRNGKDIDAVEFHFDAAINDEPCNVGIVISGSAMSAIGHWLADPNNYERAEEADVVQLATDLSVARILEAVDRGVDFDEDKKTYPESFAKISALIAKISLSLRKFQRVISRSTSGDAYMLHGRSVGRALSTRSFLGEPTNSTSGQPNET